MLQKKNNKTAAKRLNMKATNSYNQYMLPSIQGGRGNWIVNDTSPQIFLFCKPKKFYYILKTSSAQNFGTII